VSKPKYIWQEPVSKTRFEHNLVLLQLAGAILSVDGGIGLTNTWHSS
jgi:hypothetical protein